MRKVQLSPITNNYKTPQEIFDELIQRWNNLNCQQLNISDINFLTKSIEDLYKNEKVYLLCSVNVYEANGEIYSLNLTRQQPKRSIDLSPNVKFYE